MSNEEIKGTGISTIPNCVGFSDAVYIEIARLSKLGTSSATIIHGTMIIYCENNKIINDVPHLTFIKDLRRDIRIVEEIYSAIQVALCKRIIQLIL